MARTRLYEALPEAVREPVARWYAELVRTRRLLQRGGLRQLGPLVHERLSRRAVERRIHERKAERTPFDDTPRTAAVVQFFNQRVMIRPLLSALRAAGFDEILVLDDGSVDGSTAVWTDLLDGRNEFLLRSNDLHEVRTYDRALRMTDAEFVCLLQDDDLPPEDDGWVADALTLFEAFPDLQILGGRTALSPEIPEKPTDGEVGAYRVDADVAGAPGFNRYGRIPEPTHAHDGIPFSFVPVVNRAPMWVRREEFLDAGGVDRAFAPYQCDDVDACLRAWEAGRRVGLYDSGFTHAVDPGGMATFNPLSERFDVMKESWDVVYRRYGPAIHDGRFERYARRANEGLDDR